MNNCTDDMKIYTVDNRVGKLQRGSHHGTVVQES